MAIPADSAFKEFEGHNRDGRQARSPNSFFELYFIIRPPEDENLVVPDKTAGKQGLRWRLVFLQQNYFFARFQLIVAAEEADEAFFVFNQNR